MTRRAAAILAHVLLPVALLSLAAIVAAQTRVGPLQIDWPWSRATPPGATVAAGYLRISNDGEQPERLVGARSPLAQRVTIHRSVESDGTTRMLHQEDGIPIPAGGSVELEPGGYHLMLMWPVRPFDKGDRVPVTLLFERAGPVEIELHVRALTAGVE